MIQELRDILFLDIETVAKTYAFSALDERMKVQWSRKASHLRQDPELTDERLYQERAGIYAEFGKIVCIAVGKFFETESGDLGLKTKAYYGDDEKELLSEFKSMLEKTDSTTLRLCAHNGKEFDYPYLCRRLLVNELGLPSALNLMGRKPWDVQHLDTLEMWKFGDYKHYTSLDLLTAIFGIPTSKLDMDGSQVNSAYHLDNNLSKIKDYCVRDVIVLARLYLKLKSIILDKELTLMVSE
ncbi:MAG: 3'-5' exonuclease [Cyclobacteriaceae bacterium]|nr:3'-5' exonuclease [Cyclobacteriaceae bacterium]MDH4296740.1 3'-5' exonuclease [Cyclobacteriaceae bacterium]MDH5247819.1 3'-5' exonuclease [Cyclobacteriaceae bacterium]